MRLIFQYETEEGLRRHLKDALDKDALFVPLSDPIDDLKPLSRVDLCLTVEDEDAVLSLDVDGELIHILDKNGLVFRILNKKSVLDFLRSENGQGSQDNGGDDDDRRAQKQSSGTTPLSWSIEQLRSQWSTLTPAEKIRVARYGGRTVRRLVLKGMDKKLHGHLLSNPKITPDEVASMALEAALDPLVLKRIAASSEWTQYKQVVRSLIMNPKLPLPWVRNLLSKLGRQDLVRLKRSNRLRAPVRDLISKTLAKFNG